MEMISMLGLKDVWRQHFTMYVTNPIEIYLDRVVIDTQIYIYVLWILLGNTMYIISIDFVNVAIQWDEPMQLRQHLAEADEIQITEDDLCVRKSGMPEPK